MDATDIREEYVERFGTMPPTAHWHGTQEELTRLMAAALKRNRELTEDDMYEALGLEHPPLNSNY